VLPKSDGASLSGASLLACKHATAMQLRPVFSRTNYMHVAPTALEANDLFGQHTRDEFSYSRFGPIHQKTRHLVFY